MRTRKFAVLAVFFVSLVSATVTSATTRYVSTGGSNTGNCAVMPCRTTSYAVGQAAAGDTVSVAPGTYSESVTLSKRLTLVGRNESDDSAEEDTDTDHDGRSSKTTINAAGHDNGLIITGAGSSGSVVRGFTIENAGREGVLAIKTSDLTIAGNILVRNDAYGPNSPQCPAADPDDCGEALHLQSVTNSIVTGNLVQDNVGGILLTDEDGPTSGNLISNNRVLYNVKDCGITLASHFFHLGAPVAPSAGGVYQNQVLHNVSIGNGAAGIGVFAGPPGAAAWGNVVVGNTAKNNGLPGVAIHSHTPFQYVNDNVIAYNTLSGNGPDDDADTVFPTGISVFSAVVPIPHTTIAHNRISNEHFGVFTVKALKVSGLPTNKFASSVDVPIALH
jgi:parallel beta-helix repeat protein